MKKLEPYASKTLDSPKVFYHCAGEKTISRWYLLALLDVDNKGLVVQHGLSDQSYEFLVTGRSRKAGQRKFAWGEDVQRKRTGKGIRKQRRAG